MQGFGIVSTTGEHCGRSISKAGAPKKRQERKVGGLRPFWFLVTLRSIISAIKSVWLRQFKSTNTQVNYHRRSIGNAGASYTQSASGDRS